MMLRKIIHFYITSEPEQVLVHIVEMSRLPVEHLNPPPQTLIKPAHFWLCMAFNQYTAPNLKVPESPLESKPSTFTCLQRKVYSYFAPDDDNFYYKVIHSSFKLPKSIHQLYKFMLSLDGCIHDIEYNNTLYDTSVEFAYADVTGEELRFAPLAHHLFTMAAPASPKPTEYFSVYLARWIVRHQDLFSIDIVNQLSCTLSDAPLYMTKKLRPLLYPCTSHASFCQHYLVETFIANLLDPAIDSTTSNTQLLTVLKNCDDLKNHMQPIFERIEVLKKLKWAFTVKSLYVEQGIHREFYHQNHPIISLLLESNWCLMNNGQLALNYAGTKSYLENYADEKPRAVHFAQELSHALLHLGLTLTRHTTPHHLAVFDSESQIKLHHAGYHYSKKFSKSLLLTANRFRMFKASILPLEMQEFIFSCSEPTLSRHDMQLTETFTLGAE